MTVIQRNERKTAWEFYEQSPKKAKKTLTGPGLEPETSGLTFQRSSHLSYPAPDGGGPK